MPMRWAVVVLRPTGATAEPGRAVERIRSESGYPELEETRIPEPPPDAPTPFPGP